MSTIENVNPDEIKKFGSLAERWWDPQGEFRTLHEINPLRMDFIRQHAKLTDHRFVDVGCGGGILTEALAQGGADALGVDLSDELIDVAELHSLDIGSTTQYRKISAEALAAEQAASFDHVTCMEMLEHVPDPKAIVTACATLVKPGGMVFFSTLNRVPKAYLLAIVAAEHLIQMVPKGTHDYKAFIKPSELCRFARPNGLTLQAVVGISYQPFSKRFFLTKDIDVNYIAAFQRTD